MAFVAGPALVLGGGLAEQRSGLGDLVEGPGVGVGHEEVAVGQFLDVAEGGAGDAGVVVERLRRRLVRLVVGEAEHVRVPARVVVEDPDVVGVHVVAVLPVPVHRAEVRLRSAERRQQLAARIADDRDRVEEQHRHRDGLQIGRVGDVVGVGHPHP